MSDYEFNIIDSDEEKKNVEELEAEIKSFSIYSSIGGSSKYDKMAKIFNEVKEDEKHYLHIPFIYKDEAKKQGAKWDKIEKKWYVLKSSSNYETLKNIYHKGNFNRTFENGKVNEAFKPIHLFIGYDKYNDEQLLKKQKIYLYVPFDNKDEVKSKGGKYDKIKRRWYIYGNNKYIDELKNTYHTSNILFNQLKKGEDGLKHYYDKLKEEKHRVNYEMHLKILQKEAEEEKIRINNPNRWRKDD